MRVGDIVNVHDGSWSLFYAGYGYLVHLPSYMLKERRWCVLALNLVAPTYMHRPQADKPNDTMLREEDFPENISFTRAAFCVSVSRVRISN